MENAADAHAIKGISLNQYVSGDGLRIGIVHTQWNETVISALLGGAVSELKAKGVHERDIRVLSVPGSYELPLGAKCLLATKDVDAVICIGCLIKGETMHMEYIAEAVTQGIMRLGLDTGIPVIFGVLTVLKESQALARAGLSYTDEHNVVIPGKHNHGTEWAQSAITMARHALQYGTPSLDTWIMRSVNQ